MGNPSSSLQRYQRWNRIFGSAGLYLTFTHENWDLSREVIITGLWDGIPDGDSPYSIHLGPPRSDDEKYNSLPQITAWATNVDVALPQAVPAVIALETRRAARKPSAAAGQDHSSPRAEEVDVVPEGAQHW